MASSELDGKVSLVTGASRGIGREISKALAKIGIQFEQRNPFYSLLTDPETGVLIPEILNEKVISCIIEFEIPLEMLPRVLRCLQEVAPGVDSVFAVDLISVVEKDGVAPAKKIAEEIGIPVSINGKVNVGLGRPLANLDA